MKHYYLLITIIPGNICFSQYITLCNHGKPEKDLTCLYIQANYFTLGPTSCALNQYLPDMDR